LTIIPNDGGGTSLRRKRRKMKKMKTVNAKPSTTILGHTVKST
jgi:hypothetical protein